MSAIKPGNGVQEKEEKALGGRQVNSDAASPAATAAASALDLAAAGDASNASKRAAEIVSPQTADIKKSPNKRTPKRMSFIERAQKESEELVRNMGGSLEMDGGRRTRSSARGTPTRPGVTSTPPPTKRARASPTSKSNASSTNVTNTPYRARGRGRKLDTTAAAAASEEEADLTPTEEPIVAEPLSSTKKNKKTEKTSPVTADDAKAVVDETTATKPDKSEPEETQKAATDESSVSSGNKAVDETDDVLELAPEEKQNNVGHAAEAETETEEDKPQKSADQAKAIAVNESPMEIDDQSDPEPEPEAVAPPAKETVVKDTETTPAQAQVSKEEPKVAVVETAAVATCPEQRKSNAAIDKEPTPEPMEVDSNSRSNDADKKVEVEEATAVPAAIPLTSPPEQTEEKSPTKVSTSPITAGLEVTAEISTAAVTATAKSPLVSDEKRKASTENAAESNAEKSTIPAVAAADEAPLKAVNANDVVPPTVDTNSVSGEVSEEAAAIAPSTNESNKPENDLCEPKIVSPTAVTAGSDGADKAIFL